MYWKELDTDTKARLIRDGLRMGMGRWESIRDAYDAAEDRRISMQADSTDDDGDVVIDDPMGQWAHLGEVTVFPMTERGYQEGGTVDRIGYYMQPSEPKTLMQQLIEHEKQIAAEKVLMDNLKALRARKAAEEKRAALRAANPKAAAWQDVTLERIRNNDYFPMDPFFANIFTKTNMLKMPESFDSVNGTKIELEAKQSVCEFILTDGIENNHNSHAYDRELDMWIPEKSVEGGKETIGFGLKLNNTNSNWYKVYKQQGYLTDEQMLQGVNEEIDNAYRKAKRYYEEDTGGIWDELSPEWQSVIVEYAFNGCRFPKMMNAIKNGDFDEIKKQYKRFVGSKELTQRNMATWKKIEAICKKEGIWHQ